MIKTKKLGSSRKTEKYITSHHQVATYLSNILEISKNNMSDIKALKITDGKVKVANQILYLTDKSLPMVVRWLGLRKNILKSKNAEDIINKKIEEIPSRDVIVRTDIDKRLLISLRSPKHGPFKLTQVMESFIYNGHEFEFQNGAIVNERICLYCLGAGTIGIELFIDLNMNNKPTISSFINTSTGPIITETHSLSPIVNTNVMTSLIEAYIMTTKLRAAEIVKMYKRTCKILLAESDKALISNRLRKMLTVKFFKSLDINSNKTLQGVLKSIVNKTTLSKKTIANIDKNRYRQRVAGKILNEFRL